MITANEARANVKRFQAEVEAELALQTDAWVEDILNPAVIDASKAGRSCTEPLPLWSEEIAERVISVLSEERFGFTVEYNDHDIVVRW